MCDVEKILLVVFVWIIFIPYSKTTINCYGILFKEYSIEKVVVKIIEEAM